VQRQQATTYAWVFRPHHMQGTTLVRVGVCAQQQRE
jgi:hypothetical protein